MQHARKLVAAEWLPATLSCDLTFQLIKTLSEQAGTLDLSKELCLLQRGYCRWHY